MSGLTDPNFIVPTRPPGDNTTAAASTAFVIQNTLSGATFVVTTATLANAVAATLPLPINYVITQGYYSVGDGGEGIYVRLGAPPGAPRLWNFQSADGGWWQLVTPVILPRQVGAVLDALTDDTAALQAWVDYPTVFGGMSGDQPGTAANPSVPIELSPGTNIQCAGQLTIKRTTNACTAIMQAGTMTQGSSPIQGPISVRGVNFLTTAGFTSVTSHTIAAGSQTFVVPTGLPLTSDPAGALPGSWVQITSTVSTIDFEIGYVTNYDSGTGSMTVTITSPNANSGVAGPYSSWQIDLYHLSDITYNGLEDETAGLRFRYANNVIVRDCTFLGRFYDALDARNCINILFENNYIAGHVNRGIAAQAYLAFTMTGVVIDGNTVEGMYLSNPNSQYGITTGAITGTVLEQFSIDENTIYDTLFHGIAVAGNAVRGSVEGNNVNLLGSSTVSSGILVEEEDNQVPQNIAVVGNTVYLGLKGITVISALYCNVDSNNITLCGSNAVKGVGISIQGTTAKPAAFITLSGNNVGQINGSGIQIVGTGVSGVEGVVLAGNSCTANTIHGFNISGSIGSAVLYVTFSGNIANSNTGTGFNGVDYASCTGAGNISVNNGTAYNVPGIMTAGSNGNI